LLKWGSSKEIPMDERIEFLEWLKRHTRTLSLREPHDMAVLAISCGFSLDLVCEVLSQGHIDLLTQTSQQLRENYSVIGEIKQLEVRVGKPDLQEQWFALARKHI